MSEQNAKYLRYGLMIVAVILVLFALYLGFKDSSKYMTAMTLGGVGLLLGGGTYLWHAYM